MSHRTASAVTAKLLFVLGLLWPSLSFAQVVVLRPEPAAEPLCEAFEAALADFGVVADPGYFGEAQRRGLDPHGDQALTLLTTPLHVRLAVVPQGADASGATVEFRDGASGASLETTRIPLVGGVLDAQGAQVLRAEVARRLQPGGSHAPLETANGAPDAAPGDTNAAPSPSGEQQPALLPRVFAGIGMGTRSLDWPSHGERDAIATGAFVALDLGASFAIATSDAFSIGPQFLYQTSLDAHVTEMHIAGTSQSLKVRAHRFEALLAPTFRFGSQHDWYLLPAFGFGVRDLQPGVHHLLTPSYSLAGPVLRLTLRIPLGSQVGLRLGPEAQWLHVGKGLRDLGVNGSGFSVGGEAAFEIAVTHGIAIEIALREAHALLASSQGDQATDVERFATARLIGEL
jgi:hypothetical protein